MSCFSIDDAYTDGSFNDTYNDGTPYNDYDDNGHSNHRSFDDTGVDHRSHVTHPHHSSTSASLSPLTGVPATSLPRANIKYIPRCCVTHYYRCMIDIESCVGGDEIDAHKQ
jgi:hypothetical protein